MAALLTLLTFSIGLIALSSDAIMKVAAELAGFQTLAIAAQLQNDEQI